MNRRSVRTTLALPAELLGPFYSTSQVALILGGISRQAVADRRNRQTLLALRTDDGVWVYPQFQFDDHNEVMADLPPLVQCFDPQQVDGWTVAAWLVSPRPGLNGKSLIEWLKSENEMEPVLALARDAARRFTR